MRKNNSVIKQFLAFIFLLAITNNILVGNTNPRTSFSINEQWYFAYSEEDGKYSDILESQWQRINLPHTWNINDTSTDTSAYLRGFGWYKKQLTLPDHIKNKQIFLHFEGANQIAEVFVNGKKAGKHIGGYTAFTFDVSELVHFDNQNIIAVKVDNRFNKDIPPLSADFTFYGGIYRDVWLIATDPVHITLNNFGSKGIYISTPKVSNKQASVNIKGKIDNFSRKNRNIVVVNSISDPSGKEIAKINTKIKVKSEQSTEFSINEIIKKPALWSPDKPHLYSVKTELYDNDKLIDMVISPLGFRFFKMDADKGFYLNGKPLKLIGTNRHQDYAGLGNALPNRLHVKDLQMIKDVGFNFLRLAHYPQDPVVIETADRLGLIIWEEIPIVNYVTTSNAFLENSKQMMTEMIRQHYNHPSVIFWGYMNEVFLHDARGDRNKEMYFPKEYLKTTVQFAQELNDLAHKEDPGRITVMAGHQNPIYDETKISEITDAMGFNLYQGWYSSRFDHFGEFVDDMHKEFPNRKIILSEYGAGSDERLHSNNPQRFDFTTEYQQAYHESYLKQIIDRPFIGASAVWCQSDFGSNRRVDSKAKINQKGLQYFDRKPKDIYYYYQAVLSNKPVVRIASHDWQIRNNTDTAQNKQSVKIYTNLSVLDILINGTHYKTLKSNGSNILNLDLILDKGSHTIEAKGKLDNISCSDRIQMNVTDTDLILNSPITESMELAVNVGSNAQFIDDTDLVWQKDQQYKKNWGYDIGEDSPTTGSKSILGTNSDPLYQTYREGIDSYRFDVPKGNYSVELCFAECDKENPGERVMDILINEEIVWQNLDLVKDYGFLQAVSRNFNIYNDNSKGIEILFKAKKGKTILNGIYLRRK